MSRSPFPPAPGPPPKGGGTSRPSPPGFSGSPLPPPQRSSRPTPPPQAVIRSIATPSYATSDVPPPPPRRRPRLVRLAARLTRLALVLGVLGGVVYGLLNLPMWKVTSVVALGGEFTEAELQESFDVESWNDQFIWARLGEKSRLERALNAHPRIDQASVRFVLPSRLELHIKEKERYAALIVDDQAYIIARDYSCMGVEPADRVRASRLMTGLSPAMFFAADGTMLRDPFPVWPPQPTQEEMDRYYYAKLLQLWKWIDAESNPPLSQVAGLSVDPQRGLAIHYKLGGDVLYAPILLGSGADLESKYGQALTLYRSGMFRDRRDAEIDLRFNRSVVRTIAPANLTAQQGWIADLPDQQGVPFVPLPSHLPADPGTISPESASFDAADSEESL